MINQAYNAARANPNKEVTQAWGSNGHGGPAGYTVRNKQPSKLSKAPAPAPAPKLPTSYKTQKQTRANNPYYRAPEQPNYISADATEARQNNIMGQGRQEADSRYQTKKLDKAGFSRGAGQQHQAATGSARTLHDAAKAANESQANDMQLNSEMKRNYNDEVERRTQYAEGMSQQLAQSDWQRQFQQNQLNAQLFNQYNTALTDILTGLTS
jgi:hypothetical protein